MRISIDLDNDSSLKLFWAIAKGHYFLGKFPEKIRKTERGVHIIYRDTISENESIKYRKLIGDDRNRVALDLSSDLRIRQILFTEKTTTCHGYIHPYWFRILRRKSESPNFDICPCGRKVLASSKIWETNRKFIEINHIDGNCEYPIRQKGIPFSSFFKRMGVELA